MKKARLLLLIVSLVSIQLFAQKKEDALFLKNGSVVYGKILEVKEGRYKIKTADGFLFTFMSGEVEKFILANQAEPVTEPVTEPVPREVRIYDPDGFGFGIESGLLAGSPEYNFPLLFALNPMLTYTVSDRHMTGFVTGIEFFDAVYLPLSIEYRFRILKSDVSPHLYFRGGALVPLGGTGGEEDYKGGWSVGGGTGFRWPVGGFESYIKFGYRYGYMVNTRTNNYYSVNPVEYTYQVNFHRFEMKWGFKF